MKTLAQQRSLKVTVSPDSGLVIPADYLESLSIPSGRQYRVIPVGDRLELVPILSPEEARGFLNGIDTSIEDVRE
jgi:hypothetical protein